jgi:outer membrane protein OmpA-like peptidoglycan-associated protein
MMKRFLIAVAAVLFSSSVVTSATADDCGGNCHNFVTAASSGSWVTTSSGGFVQDSSVVCDILVQFEYDSALLTSDGKQSLLDNMDIIVHSGAVGFSNSGFASIEGSEDYNLALSERRAMTVYNFLEANGVDMKLITPVKGFGETEEHGAGLEANRVVVLSFNG